MLEDCVRPLDMDSDVDLLISDMQKFKCHDDSRIKGLNFLRCYSPASVCVFVCVCACVAYVCLFVRERVCGGRGVVQDNWSVYQLIYREM